MTADIEKVYNLIAAYLIQYGFQVLVGLLILFIGMKLANWTAHLATGILQKKHLDVTLTRFLAGVAKMAVLTFAILLAIDKFGITISPFIATISAMIFGASFAVQAPLSNYAAGLSIIFFRPFVVGNTVTIKGFSGVVEEVKLPCTILITGDGERITIPNKDIVGEIIVNSLENKVIETVVGISYDDNPEAAIDVIHRTLRQFPQILSQPAPQVGIQSFGDFSVNIRMRYWAPTKQHLTTTHDVNLAVYKALQDAKITIPFPRRDIHIFSEHSSASR